MKFSCLPSRSAVALLRASGREGYHALHLKIARARTSVTRCCATNSATTVINVRLISPTPRLDTDARGRRRTIVSAATVKTTSRTMSSRKTASLASFRLLGPSSGHIALRGVDPRLNRRWRETRGLRRMRSSRRMRGGCSMSGSRKASHLGLDWFQQQNPIRSRRRRRRRRDPRIRLTGCST